MDNKKVKEQSEVFSLIILAVLIGAICFPPIQGGVVIGLFALYGLFVFVYLMILALPKHLIDNFWHTLDAKTTLFDVVMTIASIFAVTYMREYTLAAVMAVSEILILIIRNIAKKKQGE